MLLIARSGLYILANAATNLIGLGSILGMVGLTRAIAVPLRTTATRLTRANRGLHGIVGLVAIEKSGVLWH